MPNEKIDMVYLWCDGNEKAFRERKNAFLKKEKNQNFDEEVDGEKRFFDNEELRYSLRSLEQYAPWINHVYIVTDRQTPKWLNLNYKKVSIVDHSEILPPHSIPCFNSDVIECFLAFIPNLSEKFLYGNDDTFFGNYVTSDFFFNESMPVVRVKELKIKNTLNTNFNSAGNPNTYTYIGTVLNSLNLLNKYYNKSNYYQLHHNIDSYTKKLFLATYKRFEKELSKFFNNRFREKDDFQRTLFSLDAVYSQNAKLKIISDLKPWRKNFHWLKKLELDSYYGTDTSIKDQKEILKFKPKLFCLNSDTNCSMQDKLQVKQFMNKLFPYPSKFEL